MVAAFFIGIAIGFVLAMPPGPISIYSIKSGIERGLRNGLMVGLGASAMDVLYSFTAMMATSALVGNYNSFTEEYPVIDFTVRMAIIAFLIIYGIIQLRYSPARDEKQEKTVLKKEESALRFFKKFQGPFFVGVAMALVNAVHPTFLPALAAQAVTVQHNGWVDPKKISEIMAFALGFGLGNMTWMYVLLKIVLRFRHHISTGFMENLRRFVAVVFIVFGLYLAFRVITITNWEILFGAISIL
ncbi:MAG: LysE family transporter [Bacteroidota bacterium]